MRAWLAVAGTLLTCGCARAPEALPEPHASVAEETCTPELYGVELVPVSNAASDLSRCAAVGWAASCEGSVEFQVLVDDVGVATVTRMAGDIAPGMRKCLDVAVRDAALGPATDCRWRNASKHHGRIPDLDP